VGRSLGTPRQWVSMVDIAYDTLLEAISDRRLAPGAHLDIREAAESLGMSPTPVREALARLSSDGITTLDANRGYRVTALLTMPEFKQLFAARRVIEFGALRQVTTETPSRPWVKALTDEQVKEIVSLEQAARTAAHGPRFADYAEFNRADTALHEAILAATGNAFLTQAWKRLHCHLHLSRLYAGPGVVDFDDACVEHGAIVQGIVQQDTKLLIKAYEAHVHNAEKRLGRLVQ